MFAHADPGTVAAVGFAGRYSGTWRRWIAGCPGKYTVALAKRQGGAITPLAGSQSFEIVAEGDTSKEDRIALAAFQDKLANLQAATEAQTRLTSIRRAIDATPSLPTRLREESLKLEKNLDDINMALAGDRIVRSHNEGVPASIAEHVQSASSPTRGTTGRPAAPRLEGRQVARESRFALDKKKTLWACQGGYLEFRSRRTVGRFAL